MHSVLRLLFIHLSQFIYYMFSLFKWGIEFCNHQQLDLRFQFDRTDSSHSGHRTIEVLFDGMVLSRVTRWSDWGYLFYCEIGNRFYKLFLLHNTNMIHECISKIIHDLMICTTVMRNSEHEIKHAQVVCCLLYLPL